MRLKELTPLDWPGTAKTKTHATSHLRFWEQKAMEHSETGHPSDRCNEKSWNPRFRVNRDSFTGESKHRSWSQYSVFTDGSKLDGKVGSGLVIYEGKREILSASFRLGDDATVFMAEVVAIAKAAEMLSGMDRQGMKFVKFFVDSQAAIRAVDSTTVTSLSVLRAIEQLNQLASKLKALQIVWIPAHKGHVGNERADDLAKIGAMSEDPLLRLKTYTPISSYKSQVRELIRNKWHCEWQELRMAQHTKTFYSRPDKHKAKFVYKLARLELGRFVRIITGHNNLSFFQNKLGYTNDVSCRLCKEDKETIVHFLTSCPRTRQSSIDHFRDKLPTNDMKWSVRTILEFSYTPLINEAYEKARSSLEDETSLESDDEIFGPESWLESG